MSELKPCPFCGGEDAHVIWDFVENGADYYAECTDCWCRGPWEPTLEKARNAWNNRPGEDKLQDRVDALEWSGEVENIAQSGASLVDKGMPQWCITVFRNVQSRISYVTASECMQKLGFEHDDILAAARAAVEKK